MCGRYLQRQNLHELAVRFGVDQMLLDWRPRYNIAPTQQVPAIVIEDGRRVLRTFRWGLVPRWADAAGIGQNLINARAETIADKPAFREAFRHRRCLIPTDGFYEWQKISGGGGKLPMCIRFKDGSAAFAGIWERWISPQDQVIESCAIITTHANELVAAVHDRMPAIIRPEHEASWLDPAITDPAKLQPLLAPYPSELMTLYPVSRRVNTVDVDDVSLIEQVNLPPQTQGELF